MILKNLGYSVEFSKISKFPPHADENAPTPPNNTAKNFPNDFSTTNSIVNGSYFDFNGQMAPPDNSPTPTSGKCLPPTTTYNKSNPKNSQKSNQVNLSSSLSFEKDENSDTSLQKSKHQSLTTSKSAKSTKALDYTQESNDHLEHNTYLFNVAQSWVPTEAVSKLDPLDPCLLTGNVPSPSLSQSSGTSDLYPQQSTIILMIL